MYISRSLATMLCRELGGCVVEHEHRRGPHRFGWAASPERARVAAAKNGFSIAMENGEAAAVLLEAEIFEALARHRNEKGEMVK